MLEEDLSYEALLQISGDTDPTKTAYYLDPPFTTTLGYDSDLDAMLVEAPVAKELWNDKNKKLYKEKVQIFYKEDKARKFTKELKDPTLPYINFHALRHTAATWILRKTNNLRITKEILGHSNINTTMKYAHVLDAEKRDALNAVFDETCTKCVQTETTQENISEKQ